MSIFCVTDLSSDRLIDWLIDWSNICFSNDWLLDWLNICFSIDWLIDWASMVSFNWLIDWLIYGAEGFSLTPWMFNVSIPVCVLLAFIPGPIIMGALIDSACRLWNTQTCGAKGACLIYDLDSLRIKMHLYVAVVKTAACVMDVYVRIQNEPFFTKHHILWYSLPKNPNQTKRKKK